MKDTVLSVLVLIFALLLITGACARPDIIGRWESSRGTLEFLGAGRCKIDGDKAFFRVIDENKVVIYGLKEGKIHTYMMSFDGKSMYFGIQRYIKSDQSGDERSIMEFLL